jgi:hypothetical protein
LTFSFIRHVESRSEYQEALQIALKAANYETASRSTHTGYNTGSSNSISSGVGSGGDAMGHVGGWKDIQSTISGPHLRYKGDTTEDLTVVTRHTDESTFHSTTTIAAETSEATL